MTITLSVAIMAHPKRAVYVAELLEWLGDPGVPVVWDRRGDRWDTGRRSMLAYDPTCSHHAVIQDDVLPCRDLLAGIKAALVHVPSDTAFSGYLGQQRPTPGVVLAAVEKARARGASFVTMATLKWGPCVVVPTYHIDAMIAFCDPLTQLTNYDRRLSQYWALQQQTRVWYAWPPLTDHRDGPSMIVGRKGTSHRGRPGQWCRIAHDFIGVEASALDMDWSGPVVHAESPTQRYTYPVVTYRHKLAGKVLIVPTEGHRANTLARNPSWELVT